WTYLVLDRGRFSAAECAADPRAVEYGSDCGRAQWQSRERDADPRTPRKPGIDFPDQQRHGSDRAPDRALEGADATRSYGRRAPAGGGRLLAGDDEQRPDLCRA